MSRGPARTTSDPKLTPLQDAIERPERTDPRSAPELRGHSVATRDELRSLRGSTDGNAGPRAVILAGNADPLDAGMGVFVWDPTSTAADDGASTIQPMSDEMGRWRRGVSPSAGSLLRVTVLSSGSGTHVPMSGTKAARWRLWGGGGGGGGVAAGGGSPFVTMAGGGGAGAHAEWTTLVIPPAGWTYAVGAAGTAGASGGGSAGGNGGSTTVSDGTTTITAPGGTGAPGNPTGSSPANVTANGAGAGGTTPTGGAQIARKGDTGGLGVHVNTNNAYSGCGGSTSAGAGGDSVVGVTAAGNAGQAPGGGGSGACEFNNTALAGGAGALGGLICEEFG